MVTAKTVSLENVLDALAEFAGTSVSVIGWLAEPQWNEHAEAIGAKVGDQVSIGKRLGQAPSPEGQRKASIAR
jgi:cell division inhibitor SulA